MSEPSKGRERGCVALLTSDSNWSAEQIVSNLASLPTDAHHAAQVRAGQRFSSASEAQDGAASSASAERILQAQGMRPQPIDATAQRILAAGAT